jgi:hypothetical protein
MIGLNKGLSRVWPDVLYSRGHREKEREGERRREKERGGQRVKRRQG